MTITLGSTTLCAGQARNSTGSPVGPRDLHDAETPGVILREYIGADRVTPDHVGCNHGTVTFGVTRTYATVAEATAYALVGHRSEAVSGELKYDDATVFASAAVTARSIAQIGCTVVVNYTIEG